MDRAATFDETGTYRYRLDRRWKVERGKRITFVMLNPSTADAFKEDPTITRCIGFAKRLNFPAMTVVNLFALRATDPKELRRHKAPVGPDNDRYIGEACLESMMVICAWGAYPHLRGRDLSAWAAITEWQSILYCLGVTKSGAPRHPLYLKKEQDPEPFRLSR